MNSRVENQAQSGEHLTRNSRVEDQALKMKCGEATVVVIIGGGGGGGGEYMYFIIQNTYNSIKYKIVL